LSSLVSPPFCLSQKTTFKEIKAEKRSSSVCRSYWKLYHVLLAALLPENFRISKVFNTFTETVPNYADGFWYYYYYYYYYLNSEWFLYFHTHIRYKPTAGYSSRAAIPSFSSLSHDRSKHLPERALNILRSKVSSFKWEYPLLSLRSSSSFLRLLPLLPFTSVPLFTFPSVTCRRRQFLRKSDQSS
jgi:hypothetical protein